MPESRLQRTRAAYDRQPTDDEIQQAWMDMLNPDRLTPQWRTWTDEHGYTHRERIPPVFIPR